MFHLGHSHYGHAPMEYCFLAWFPDLKTVIQYHNPAIICLVCIILIRHVLKSTVLLMGLYCVILCVITGIHYRIDAAESAANVFGCIDKIFLENCARKIKDKVIFV